MYVSLSDSRMVHDEQAIFVIEPCVEIQKHVRDEHQIYNPVYDLHDEERNNECTFFDVSSKPCEWRMTEFALHVA